MTSAYYSPQAAAARALLANAKACREATEQQQAPPKVVRFLTMGERAERDYREHAEGLPRTAPASGKLPHEDAVKAAILYHHFKHPLEEVAACYQISIGDLRKALRLGA